MVEAADEVGGVDPATIGDWRVWASVADLGFEHRDPADPLLPELLRSARVRVEEHGDVHPEDVRDWYLLDDLAVANGFLRSDVLPVEALLDVLDGFDDLVAGVLEPEPPGAWWFLGVPGGRRTIEMRTDRT